MLSRKSIHKGLFSLAVISFYLYGLFRQLDFSVPTYQSAIFILEKITIAFSFSCLFYCEKKQKLWYVFFSVLLPLSIFFFIFYGYRIIAPVLLIFAASNLKAKFIINVLYKSIIIVFILSFLFLFLGITFDTEMHRNEDQQGISREMAHTLGFYHYSGFSFRTICITILYLITNRFRLKWLSIILIIVANYFVFILTETRLHIILTMAIIVLFTLSYKLNLLNFRRSLWKVLSFYIYPLMFFLFFLMGFFSLAGFPEIYVWWDMKFSGRMSMTLLAFAKYPISLFGNKIEMIGARDAEVFSIESFYIDSGYVYWILAYGFLFTFVLLFSYVLLMYKSYKLNIKYLYIWLLVFSFANLINDFFGYFDCNPVLLFLFSQLDNKTDRYGS